MFKGKRSVSWVNSSRLQYNIEAVYDPHDSKKRLFPPKDFIVHPQAGLIHARQMIFDTGYPLPGILNLGNMIFSGQTLPLTRIRKSLTITTLIASINDFLNRDVRHGAACQISIEDIKSLRVCKHDLCIWLVEFKGSSQVIHPVVGDVIKVLDESDGGNQGSKNESAGVVNAMNFTALRHDLKKLQHELDKFGKGIKGKAFEMSVGVVDRGPFNFDVQSGEVSHATVIGEIIKFEGYVQPVACPMVPHYKDPATVFDMICALRNTSIIETVQVINISQGFYSLFPHPVLHKVLKHIDKPIICSAGNEKSDNDVVPHWPSNFSLELNNVFSVSSIDANGQFSVNSNSGVKSVLLSARGEWAAGTIVGTSYAAAWLSRMVALAFAIKRRVDLNLSDVEYLIKELTPHRVESGSTDPTVTKIRFLP